MDFRWEIAEIRNFNVRMTDILNLHWKKNGNGRTDSNSKTKHGRTRTKKQMSMAISIAYIKLDRPPLRLPGHAMTRIIRMQFQGE